jgi:hypothetical protein
MRLALTLVVFVAAAVPNALLAADVKFELIRLERQFEYTIPGGKVDGESQDFAEEFKV